MEVFGIIFPFILHDRLWHFQASVYDTRHHALTRLVSGKNLVEHLRSTVETVEEKELISLSFRKFELTNHTSEIFSVTSFDT